ncbi:MAG: hypothetical protein KAI81_08810 [Candidatus Marinimicrobia bacterium]|nr:hypothetical protein [Candidatus Neomarinimicrobiota bacterium]
MTKYTFYIYLILVTIIVGLPSFLLYDGLYVKDAYTAALLSFCNAAVAYYLAVKSVGLSYQGFVKLVFGGMTIRILVMAVTAIVLIKSEVVATIPFFLCLVLYYIIHQIIEIGMLNRNMPGKNQKKEVSTK